MKGERAVTDDQAAMRLLQEGDDAAFEQIVRRWEKPMLNFFYRSVGDLDVAEDLRQDLFVRLFAYRASYRGNGTFRAWLYQMATKRAAHAPSARKARGLARRPTAGRRRGVPGVS